MWLKVRGQLLGVSSMSTLLEARSFFFFFFLPLQLHCALQAGWPTSLCVIALPLPLNSVSILSCRGMVLSQSQAGRLALQVPYPLSHHSASTTGSSKIHLVIPMYILMIVSLCMPFLWRSRHGPMWGPSDYLWTLRWWWLFLTCLSLGPLQIFFLQFILTKYLCSSLKCR